VAGYDVEDELGIKLPTKDQKQVPSCVGEAAATLAYVINAFELLRVYGHGSVLKDHLQELSSKSVYSQIALGFDQGAYISDGAELLWIMELTLKKRFRVNQKQTNTCLKLCGETSLSMITQKIIKAAKQE